MTILGNCMRKYKALSQCKCLVCTTSDFYGFHRSEVRSDGILIEWNKDGVLVTVFPHPSFW